MDSTDAERRDVSDRWESPNYDGYEWDEYGECDLIREAYKWIYDGQPVDLKGLHRMVHLLRAARVRGDNLERRLEHSQLRMKLIEQLQNLKA